MLACEDLGQLLSRTLGTQRLGELLRCSDNGFHRHPPHIIPKPYTLQGIFAI